MSIDYFEELEKIHKELEKHIGTLVYSYLTKYNKWSKYPRKIKKYMKKKKIWDTRYADLTEIKTVFIAKNVNIEDSVVTLPLEQYKKFERKARNEI